MYIPIGEYGVLSVLERAVGAFDRPDLDIASSLAANAETIPDSDTQLRGISSLLHAEAAHYQTGLPVDAGHPLPGYVPASTAGRFSLTPPPGRDEHYRERTESDRVHFNSGAKGR